MAFHGGLIGAALGVSLFARRTSTPALTVFDLASLVAPIGIFLGRLANFIKPELWGRPTDVPWAIVFPGSDGLPRHPSQIYEALLEGLAVFVVLSIAARAGALRRPGLIAGAFGVLYGVARIFCEFFRDPDPRLEDLGGGLTMGMVLSAPLIVIGVALIAWSLRAAARGTAMSALGDQIKTMIAANGPITVERFMELALADPDHGYYMNRDPFGTEGDFTTAPEISQMFGELIGLWAAEVWTSMGRPNPVRLIELGPGRGTLMSDALRAARIVPEFRAALDVTLIETSPPLAQIQYDALLTARRADRLAGDACAEAPDGPAIILANEFLDALPVRQFVRRGGRWRERMVRLDDAGELGVRRRRRAGALSSTPRPTRARCSRSTPSRHRFMFELAARLVKQGGAALFVDYGHGVDRLRRHAAGAARPSHGRPARRSRRSGPHRPCRFRRDGAQRARDRRGRLRPDRPGRLPARARHRRAHPRARRARRPSAPTNSKRRAAASSARARAKWARCSRRWSVANRSVPPPPGFQPNPAKPA